MVDQRAAWWSERPYEKTLHERNFKHWLMHVEHRVGPDGRIRDAGEWAAQAFEAGGGVAGQVARQAEVDPDWQAIGPFETYNNGDQGHFPVSWQCNIYCFDQCAANPDVAIAGIEAGDLFKTDDRGLTWTPASLSVPGVRTVTQCAIAPSSPSTFTSCPTIRSTARPMRARPGFAYDLGSSANQMIVHPTDPGPSMWRPTTAFADLGRRRRDRPGQVWDVRYHPTDVNTNYALVHEPLPERCAFHRSDDGGATFLFDNGYFVPSDPDAADDHGGRLGTTPADPDRVYVALIGKGKASDTGWIGLYPDDDRGDLWTNPNGQDGATMWMCTRAGHGQHERHRHLSGLLRFRDGGLPRGCRPRVGQGDRLNATGWRRHLDRIGA